MHIDHYIEKILPLREQVAIRNGWLKQRLETFLPHLMAREGFDMWIVIAREYNEDPITLTLLPQPAMSARRRTILLFTKQDNGSIERLTVSRYGLDGYYRSCWNPDEEEQYDCLARLVRERNPQTIGFNTSQTFAFGDGLSHAEFENVRSAFGPDLMARVKSAERLCVGWLEHRIEAECTVYPGIVEIGHALIATAFSSSVIHPGITSTEDVVWWMRQKMQQLGLEAWFPPTVEIQADDMGFDAPPGGAESGLRTLILPGDLLHCDVGFHYLGLATDQQQHAYVLKPGEDDAPAGFKAALADGNRLQEILMQQMQVGRSGNQVLQKALGEAEAEGITPSIYSHPLGYHGHAAGPTIGLWDRQDGVPGVGDYELFDQTVYSIELNVTKAIPERGNRTFRIALEEDALLFDGKMRWLDGRQTAFHLI